MAKRKIIEVNAMHHILNKKHWINLPEWFKLWGTAIMLIGFVYVFYKLYLGTFDAFQDAVLLGIAVIVGLLLQIQYLLLRYFKEKGKIDIRYW